MSKVKEIYKLLIAESQAQAKWEIEVSQAVLKDRKRLAAVILMFLPALLLPSASAALPTILGGKHAYAPAFSTLEILEISVFVGLCAGLITGCIGAGGGFVITPALMSAGIQGILAVGTDMFHIFSKAIMGTVVHKKLGNVSVGLTIAFVIGSILGATCGGYINRAIYYANPVMSDAFISLVYVFLLGFLGFYALKDYLNLREVATTEKTHLFDGNGAETTTKLALKVQSIKLPPMIHFDENIVPGGRCVSAWPVCGVGFIVGLVCAIMGVGGGFLAFPLHVYVLGVSSFTTVGTNIFQIIFTAGYASITQYAVYGFVFYTLAMGLLVGSLAGIQIGALVTKVVRGYTIRGLYATAILAGFVNRLFALPEKLSDAGVISVDKMVASALNLIGIVIFFIIIGSFAGWVLLTFARNFRLLKEV